MKINDNKICPYCKNPNTDTISVMIAYGDDPGSLQYAKDNNIKHVRYCFACTAKWST